MQVAADLDLLTAGLSAWGAHRPVGRCQSGPMKPRGGDRGATAVEYGLIVAAIAVVIVLAVVLVGRNLSGSFSDSADAVGNAVGGGGAGGAGPAPYAGPVPLASYTQDLSGSGTYALPSIPGIVYTLGACGPQTVGGCGKISLAGSTISVNNGWGASTAVQTVAWTIPATASTQSASGSFTVTLT